MATSAAFSVHLEDGRQAAGDQLERGAEIARLVVGLEGDVVAGRDRDHHRLEAGVLACLRGVDHVGAGFHQARRRPGGKCRHAQHGVRPDLQRCDVGGRGRCRFAAVGRVAQFGTDWAGDGDCLGGSIEAACRRQRGLGQDGGIGHAVIRGARRGLITGHERRPSGAAGHAAPALVSAQQRRRGTVDRDAGRGGVGCGEIDAIGAAVQIEVRVQWCTRHSPVLLRKPHDQVALGRNLDAGRKGPEERCRGLVAQAIARQLDESVARVVQLHPVFGVPVGVTCTTPTASDDFVDDHTAGSRRGCTQSLGHIHGTGTVRNNCGCCVS